MAGLNHDEEYLGIALDPYTASAETLVNIGKTVAEISDMKKRREYEQVLSKLSFEEQKRLNNELAKAKSQSDRLSILAQNYSSLQQLQIAEQGKKETRLAIIVLGGAVALLLAVYLIKKAK